uniref:Anoctamin n=1 Tax=Sinocyclocheilus rhinocerous TaxID=307959 RepID=A0A673H5F9_9TELE
MKRKKNLVEDSTTLIALSDHPEQTYGSMEVHNCLCFLYIQSYWQPKLPVSYCKFTVNFYSVFKEASTLKCPFKEPKSDLFRCPEPNCLKEHFLMQIKVGAKLRPRNVLCYYAEEISLRVPLQVVTTPISIWSEKILEKLHIPNIMEQDVPNLPPDYYTCQFRSNKLERFLGHENKDTFFKTTQRHQILYEILARTPYGSLKRGEVGIGRLVSEHVLTAAFPLHEGPSEMPKTPVDPQSLNMRQILHHYWARWACWRKYQPLDHIREYFGEKIALYFAWLGFYTGWLLPAAVVGFIIFLFGIWLVVTDVAAEELCTSGDTFVKCPLCNICSYWNLSSICYTYKAGLLFDNGGTVFFSIFMSLWAVTFLEYWKRTSSILSHRWDCSEFEEIEERPRPEFTALAPMTVRNPVTGAEEPYFPETQRLSRTLTGNMVIILMIAIVLIFLIAIILYRTILSIIIYRSQNAFFIFSAGRIASLTGSMLNLLVILLLSRLYTYLAQILTRWEMHRTQTKYEDAFILKVFIFQFVNFYSSPVYIAFFKGRFVGYPGNYNTLLGIRNEDCGASGCLSELAQELLVIMVGKQVISNIQEFVLPKLKTWWHRRKLKPAPSQEVIDEPDSKPELSPWEANYQLLVCEGLFDEYLEMSDMLFFFSFETIYITIMQHILFDALFFCQAFLIAFTSDFLPRSNCFYNALLFHSLELHVVLLIGRIIDWMVPDIPEEVEIKIKREHYMAKEALAENQVKDPGERGYT